jgi:hypothetical protein
MQFTLRFPKNEIAEWALLYGKVMDDDVPTAIGRVARTRGYLDRHEFLEIARWKSPRTQPRCAENDGEYVEAITRIALATSHEQVAIEVLTLLRGVSWPTASVVLHFCSGKPYPIIDYRALWSLSVSAQPKYDFGLWSAYVKATRALASRCSVDMRTLDRALWAFSKARQPTNGAR